MSDKFYTELRYRYPEMPLSPAGISDRFSNDIGLGPYKIHWRERPDVTEYARKKGMNLGAAKKIEGLFSPDEQEIVTESGKPFGRDLENKIHELVHASQYFEDKYLDGYSNVGGRGELPSDVREHFKKLGGSEGLPVKLGNLLEAQRLSGRMKPALPALRNPWAITPEEWNDSFK